MLALPANAPRGPPSSSLLLSSAAQTRRRGPRAVKPLAGGPGFSAGAGAGPQSSSGAAPPPASAHESSSSSSASDGDEDEEDPSTLVLQTGQAGGRTGSGQAGGRQASEKGGGGRYSYMRDGSCARRAKSSAKSFSSSDMAHSPSRGGIVTQRQRCV